MTDPWVIIGRLQVPKKLGGDGYYVARRMAGAMKQMAE